MSYVRIIGRQPTTELARIADALIFEINQNNLRLTSIENHLADTGYVPLSKPDTSKFEAMVSKYDSILNAPDYVEHEPVRPAISYSNNETNGFSGLINAYLGQPFFAWGMAIILLLMVAHPIFKMLGVFAK